jgi:hypothetical protein
MKTKLLKRLRKKASLDVDYALFGILLYNAGYNHKSIRRLYERYIREDILLEISKLKRSKRILILRMARRVFK